MIYLLKILCSGIAFFISFQINCSDGWHALSEVLDGQDPQICPWISEPVELPNPTQTIASPQSASTPIIMPKARKKKAKTNGVAMRTIVSRPPTPKNISASKQAAAKTTSAAAAIPPLPIHVHPSSDNDDWKDEDYTELILECFLKDAFEKEDTQNKKAKK